MAFQPCDIRDVWSVVRKGLEIVKESTDQQWIPEDVYSLCVSKKAFLYMDRDRTPDGFAVFQSQLGSSQLLFCLMCVYICNRLSVTLTCPSAAVQITLRMMS